MKGRRTKSLMMATLLVVAFVGCDKESSGRLEAYESLVREGCAIEGRSAERTEEIVRVSLESFRKLPDEQQVLALEDAEKMVELGKRFQK